MLNQSSSFHNTLWEHCITLTRLVQLKNRSGRFQVMFVFLFMLSLFAIVIQMETTRYYSKTIPCSLLLTDRAVEIVCMLLFHEKIEKAITVEMLLCELERNFMPQSIKIKKHKMKELFQSRD